MKEPDYQQRIRQLEEALRESEKREASVESRLKESKEREASVQERLKEAVSELGHTKAQVADLQIVVQKGHQDLRETKLQYEVDRKKLIFDHETTREELKTVHNQLDIATHGLIDARKDKESLEVCYRSVRGMPSSICCCVCYRSGGSTMEAGCFTQVSVLGGARTIV